MENSIKDDTWIWVIVQDPGGDEQLLGQLDEEHNISFIPAFFQKEDAEQCFLQLQRQKGLKYEIQAIFFDELSKDASKNGFLIFMLSAEGEILEKIKPWSGMPEKIKSDLKCEVTKVTKVKVFYLFK